MQTLNTSYRSMSFLLALNWDRLFFPAAIAAAMFMAAYVVPFVQ
ncbi:MAG: hypothetical protein N4A70_15955 [Pelagimonas sp.]|jgi:hypothetical protein|nr:hypothetical protein [Pelagimonas sp.]